MQASINKHALQLLILALIEIANVVNVYICDSILWSVSSIFGLLIPGWWLSCFA